ncbi:MAG TPA: hypothetical protein VJC37_06880 [Planctomycetota bacterium]|nr:hypothetical protein [Planctomycetota bacterium]
MSGEDKKIGLVQIKVNGQVVPIKGFVQDFIGFSIIGMLKSLNNVPEPQEIEIKVKAKPE